MKILGRKVRAYYKEYPQPEVDQRLLDKREIKANNRSTDFCQRKTILQDHIMFSKLLITSKGCPTVSRISQTLTLNTPVRRTFIQARFPPICKRSMLEASKGSHIMKPFSCTLLIFNPKSNDVLFRTLFGKKKDWEAKRKANFEKSEALRKELLGPYTDIVKSTYERNRITITKAGFVLDQEQPSI